MQNINSLAIPETLAEIVRPETTALVVYDMQVGILQQMQDSGAILGKVLQTLEIARSAGIRIFFMRHMSLPKKIAGVFQFKQIIAWQRKTSASNVEPWFLRDSPSFALAPELDIRKDEAILDKITFSAFEGTPLAIAMRDCGLKSFIICRIATEISIDPTVRNGADLGFVPVVLTDACSGSHAEAAEQSIANLAYIGDAMLCTVEELSAAVQ